MGEPLVSAEMYLDLKAINQKDCATPKVKGSDATRCKNPLSIVCDDFYRGKIQSN